MTARKTHDADLCERVRELEKRIEELEAAPRVTYYPSVWTYPYPGTAVPWTPNPYPWVWYGTTSGTLTTAKGVTVGDTYTIGDIS